MNLLSEKRDGQIALIDYLIGIGWEYITPSKALEWRDGSLREPFLLPIAREKLVELNKPVVTAASKDVEGLSKIIPLEEAVRNDYNFSPSRYVASNDKEEYLPIEEVLVELAEVEEERREIDSQLNEILQKLGFEGYLESVGV